MRLLHGAKGRCCGRTTPTCTTRGQHDQDRRADRVFRAIDAGRLQLDDTRVLQASDKVGGSGVLRELHTGLSLTLHDLAHLMIAISDNTASNMLIDAAGLDAVNASLRDLGAANTVLGRRFLGRASQPGEPENLTTTADLALLLRAILTTRPPVNRPAQQCLATCVARNTASVSRASCRPA